MGAHMCPEKNNKQNSTGFNENTHNFNANVHNFNENVHNLDENDHNFHENIHNIREQQSFPNIHVKSALLEKYQISLSNYNIDGHLIETKRDICYEVKGLTFFEQEKLGSDENTEFELYATRNDYFETKESKINVIKNKMDNGNKKDLDFNIQIVPHGVIINSILYLTEHHWNTLVFMDSSLLKCVVCDICITLLECPEHMSNVDHKKNLALHKPLDKFDLSITREIGVNYHCGVCNEIFHKNNKDEHFDSKTHGDKQLFAFNKASDIMFDSDIFNGNRNNDCYHFDANAINNNNIERPYSNTTYSDDYTDYTNSESADYDYEYSNSESADFDNEFRYDDNGNIDNEVHFTGVSYASMLKKKAMKVPKFITVESGANIFKIPFEYWHMISVHKKTNTFYCMACKLNEHLRMKSKHCVECTHVENLNRFNLVETYKDHIVRQVNEKLYHCAHCNHLQLIHDMDSHLSRNHSRNHKKSESRPSSSTLSDIDNKSETRGFKNNDKIYNENENRGRETNTNNNIAKNQEIIRSNNASTNSNSDLKMIEAKENSSLKTVDTIRNDKVTDDNGNRNNDGKVGDNVNKNNENTINNQTDDHTVTLNYLYSIMSMIIFNCKFNMTVMSYNVLCPTNDGFYCGLCDSKYNTRNIISHTADLKHVMLLQSHPFLVEFNWHLIRPIRGALHCGICNMPVEQRFIGFHVQQRSHIDMLNKLLTIEISTRKQLENTLKVEDTTQNETKESHDTNVSKGLNTANVTKSEDNVKESKFNVTDSKINVEDSKINVEDSKFNVKEVESNVTEIEFNEHESEFNDDDDEDNLNDTIETALDVEECVYVKINGYLKITLTSYNSLVQIGNSNRFCFICNVEVDFDDLKNHVNNREHEKNLKEFHFLDKYGQNLIRQAYLLYHCSVCNVIFRRSELTSHLKWSIHTNCFKEISGVTKRQRKNDFKSGINIYTLPTKKEQIFLNVEEPKIRLHFRAIISDNNKTLDRKSKIIMLNDEVLKVSWEAWNSIVEGKEDLKCVICEENRLSNFPAHVMSRQHEINLEKTFIKEYFPALLREVNKDKLHCVTCNNEISNNADVIFEHINGKKHIKNYDLILKNSSETNTYMDCQEEPLVLEV